MIIGIPVYDQVDLLDVTGPYEMFRWAKFEIELVANGPASSACATASASRS